MEPIKEALTFDDVLLLPQYSSIVPANTNINVSLSVIQGVEGESS